MNSIKEIVIVEDDFLLQELHKSYVENLGHKVVATFEKGSDAIEYFKKNDADLIMMDIRLEDSIDGIDTIAQIHQNKVIPVIYVSANTNDSHLNKAFRTDTKGVLSKPLSVAELEVIINSLNTLTDSVLYAERIQKALFPDKKDIHKVFRHSICFNSPKHVISGDFAFLINKQKQSEVIGGIGDCTGHGIPAALLSVLCHEILSALSKKNKDLRVIINKLNISLMDSLNKLDKAHTVSDGLDLIIFKVLPLKSKIEIAGINRPFIHYNAATKSVHYYKLKGNSIGTPYEDINDIPLMTIDYSPNDYFFFFSDGVTDQFGGPKSRKLMAKGLIDSIEGLLLKPYEIWEIELEIFLRKWRNTLEQTDDIILLGIAPSKLMTLL